MARERYDHQKVEPKWQDIWYASDAFRAPEVPGKPKAYILDMFPYPSGDGLHVGHPEGYTASDIFSRYLRMQGKAVLHPMGWDAFGLPAENYAIKTGTHPTVTLKKNLANFKRQIQALGFSYDWSREVNTTDPEYYKWTQWIFLKLFEHGLAYEAEAPINWCPKDKTGLANEEVVGGKCDRCGTVVEKKNIRQWLVKITDAKYIERLLNDLDNLDWPTSIKQSQRNWIGKSEGAEVNFELRTKNGEPEEGEPNFLILHGYTGRADKNFIPSLKKQLEAKGYAVRAPQLPNTDAPTEVEQVSYVLKHCTLDENTVIIGHSLGGVVAMKVVEKLKHPIAQLVLVAPAKFPDFRDGEPKPYARTFIWDFDFKKIIKNAPQRTILSDTLEKASRGKFLEHLSEKLHARISETEAKRKHFTANDEPFILNSLFPTKKSESKSSTVLRFQSSVITVFTTRPDTLYGATYMVLAPEHALVEKITTPDQQKHVAKYQKQASQKSDLERTELAKEKTGVFTGAYAVNPVNNEKIPVWIADYVLSSYGTGAIMAVPAHDERDFVFAKKYELPIVPVIAPLFVKADGPDGVRADLPFTEREAVVCIIKHWSQEKYLAVKWKANGWQGLVIGGIEHGESTEVAGAREISEETGYQNMQRIGVLDGIVHSQFYQSLKNQNRFAHFHAVVMKLTDGKQLETDEKEKAMHDFVWLSEKEMNTFITHEDMRYIWKKFLGKDVYSGEGVMVTPSAAPPLQGGEGKDELTYVGPYEGLTSQEFRKIIVAWLEKTGKGKAATNYKLRDWVFSRQRYWGEPIPIVHCEKCKASERRSFIIAHGITGHSAENWFPWFKSEVEKLGHEVLIPDLPNSEYPELDSWVSVLESAYNQAKYPVTLIGHSLGAPTVCHLLSTKSIKVEQMLLVAPTGKSERLWKGVKAVGLNDEQVAIINSFNDSFVDFESIKSRAPKRNIYFSKDDPFIPLTIQTDYKELDAEVKIFEDKKHFNQSFGITTLPEIFEDIFPDGARPVGVHAVPEDQLPVLLPDVKKYEPTGTGESPLAGITDWVNTKCPQCGGSAKRETNTMPQWAGSNWYFLRYCDPHNNNQLADPEKLKAWLPVDTYIGGAEHAVLHLLYARFIYKFLHDIKVVPKSLPDEPFTKLINQGLILAEDGQKMSKSRGNVINPDLIVREYGADSLRMFEMFMGPLEDAKPWSTRGIVGVRRFLDKVWQLQDKVQDGGDMHRETHGLVKQIGDDIASFSLNTAVSNFMKWVNAATEWESVSKNEFEVFLTLLSPFAPHIAQELWKQLGHSDQVHAQTWPTFDASKVMAENVEVVVQVNGKVRDKFVLASGMDEAALKAKALASEKIQTWLGGKQPKKVIVVKGKLVSIVI